MFSVSSNKEQFQRRRIIVYLFYIERIEQFQIQVLLNTHKNEIKIHGSLF